MADEERTQAARAIAEDALVRVIHFYGATPEFVLLGGLVPQLLCSASPFRHAGTTDVDVQVDLEIAGGALNAARLEHALKAGGFEPVSPLIWRWRVAHVGARSEVRFELLADLDDQPTKRSSSSRAARRSAP